MKCGKPEWLRSVTLGGVEAARVRSLIDGAGLHTVCREAACPNQGRCFENGTATFLILGDTCTRRCAYCAVRKASGPVPPPPPDEPERVASAVEALGLKYAVVTSVTRDDLADGGASIFADTIAAIRKRSPSTKVEVLTPDFKGCGRSLSIVGEARPDVFNHNVETVERLFPALRPGASYRASLDLLSTFRRIQPGIPTKSGIMLGLGESAEDIRSTLADLRSAGVTMLTLGQYLQPTRNHQPVDRFVTPAEFDRWRSEALAAGFAAVASGPLVRSSFDAAAAYAGLSVHGEGRE
ncbi:MAG TPA: lipoyl synthase [Candidatus Fermentibacter daniensis]|nr:lipoyl synthase [Candidatus Fermentibacter daniensis]